MTPEHIEELMMILRTLFYLLIFHSAYYVGKQTGRILGELDGVSGVRSIKVLVFIIFLIHCAILCYPILHKVLT